jgi:hypothetical protein
MANVLEATIDAVKSTSSDVAGAAKQGAEALGEQVSALASKVTDLIEPEKKHSTSKWWWGLFVLVVAMVAVAWWRRSAADRGDEARTDASGAPRQPTATGVRAAG